MDNSLFVLPACYLPPVSYFSTIHGEARPLLLERYEHYPKQTYRNRACIFSANGRLDLMVPIQRGRNGHVRMKDVRISYDWDWQRLHWMSLQTAYRSSAYFEFFEDDFAPFYHRRHEWLFDFNLAQLELLLRLLKVERSIGFTEGYRDDYPQGTDFRRSIHPKRTVQAEAIKPYYQVFGDKAGFLPNLSIVDLLFNHGAQSKGYL